MLFFNNGKFQSSRKWLGHIALPLHAFCLYRLEWYGRASGASQHCPCPLSYASHPDVEFPMMCRWFEKEEWAEYHRRNTAKVVENRKELEQRRKDNSEIQTVRQCCCVSYTAQQTTPKATFSKLATGVRHYLWFHQF